MTERQKKLIGILGEIGETQPQKHSKRSEADSLTNGIKKVENLLVQEGLLEKEPVAKLTKGEREELMDVCLQMRTDNVETLNVCMSINAFIVSLLALLVSVVSTVISSANQINSPITVGILCFTAVVIAGIVVILFSSWAMSKKNAKKADRYRDAYILLRFLQGEEEAERKREP